MKPREAKVVQAAQEYYSSLNDTEIEAMGATEEIVENLYREYAMADKVYQLIIQDINPEISDDEARKITVQQIFCNSIHGYGRKPEALFGKLHSECL